MPPGCRRAWVTEAHLCSRQPLPARGRGQRPALRSPSLPGTRVLQAYARSAEEVRQLLRDRGGRRAGGGVRREERGEGRGARGGWPWVREDPFTAEQTRWPWAAAGCRGRRPGCREQAEHRLLTARTRNGGSPRLTSLPRKGISRTPHARSSRKPRNGRFRRCPKALRSWTANRAQRLGAGVADRLGLQADPARGQWPARSSSRSS